MMRARRTMLGLFSTNWPKPRNSAPELTNEKLEAPSPERRSGSSEAENGNVSSGPAQWAHAAESQTHDAKAP